MYKYVTIMVITGEEIKGVTLVYYLNYIADVHLYYDVCNYITCMYMYYSHCTINKSSNSSFTVYSTVTSLCTLQYMINREVN